MKLVPAELCGLPAEWGDVVVLPGFGAVNGMILLPKQAKVLEHWQKIVEHGFGFSVVETPMGSEHNLESTMDMLRDWTWCEAEEDCPSWY